uniref:NADH dehydrogenase subunit 6 n=1 Tax=Terebratalia transversa TaxID=34513 RepID=Q953X3_TERTR|nr:NADH dehydrogenase subunit 6 [Terebratalia transversa]AAK95503.1 NADH dehydrogenase subunit 6 [Terebratalia transversa]
MNSSLLFSVVVGVVSVFILSCHPVSMGCSLLVSSMLCCMVVGMESEVWYGMIVLLVYTGGMLVMFGYMVAITPNFGSGMVKSGGGFSLFLGVFVFVVSLCAGGEEDFCIEEGVSLVLNGTKILSGLNCPVLLLFGLILFIALLVVSRLCQHYKAPLRHFMVV